MWVHCSWTGAHICLLLHAARAPWFAHLPWHARGCLATHELPTAWRHHAGRPVVISQVCLLPFWELTLSPGPSSHPSKFLLIIYNSHLSRWAG